MAEERVQRRLAAILAADVLGLCRLMGEDEIHLDLQSRSSCVRIRHAATWLLSVHRARPHRSFGVGNGRAGQPNRANDRQHDLVSRYDGKSVNR